MAQVLVSMQHITKRFGDFYANQDVNLSVHAGEVLALLGENGAGKSTLMSILSGLRQPTSGTLMIKGQPVSFRSPRDATLAGIGMVHQHFMLVQAFTGLENVLLGDELVHHGVLAEKRAQTRIQALADTYHLNVNLNQRVAEMSVGMQQRLEILKTLYRNADIVILDEPTAVLTPQEITSLMEIIHQLTQEGKAVIFISHKLSEIKAIADQCVVIRHGQVIQTLAVNTTDESTLADLMVGRHVSRSLAKPAPQLGTVSLALRHLSVKDHRGIERVHQLDLDVSEGEIVGVAGIDGNGQSELLSALTGMLPASADQFTLNGQDMRHRSPRQFTQQGQAYIPEDRQTVGLILPFTLAENLMGQGFMAAQNYRFGLLNYPLIRAKARQLIQKFDIRTVSEQVPAASLSGGNQQKLIIARELSRHPNLLIAANPTRGLDVGAIEYVHQSILDQRNQGKAVLLVSFELDEILQLADRIVVMHDGEIIGAANPAKITRQELGLLMAGSPVERPEAQSYVTVSERSPRSK
ncbi:ABC transporter ATP-binding protein [Levilactobacillus bambusae]|uniref:Heme ABC transporter ATP-binding protein n=1 Tax=Levilactobacillus bambusae TaxID=2024736 RepID=A0A2V1N287_9LACO|nr:ABC transporter ATP-binding protein [Levilactobacillus bambusae]PWG00406.1 heme ABC transporter ATP-binding protein [Levilactobacillus bambusae]